jgi:predicted dehydrogenase
MGREHAAILAASPAAELSVCCDIDPEAERHVPSGTRFTTSIDDALSEPELEAVFVATPPGHHRAAVEAATRRGMAVFCEKPIAHSLDDADAILALAGRVSTPIVVGHMFRFETRYRALRQAIDEGRLGRVVHAAARGLTPDFEGRALAERTTLATENAIHGLDVLRWMAGDIERVYAETSRTGVVGDGLPDALVATIRFRSGAVGTMESDWALPSGAGIVNVDHILVVGSNGLAWYDGIDSGAAIVTAAGPPSFPGLLSVRDPGGVPYGLYRTEDEHFLASVRDGRPWPLTLEDARAALLAALALDRSLAEGRPIELTAMG